ncbi:CHAT domain-containing protein [Chroococcidiopsidales cyanobacterium LEGE 13417]|nr:CHAT domain-containing protein [Chroococcidiopsidales cyanobacterium LEGE 13417]
MSKSWYWWKHFLLGIGLSLLIFLGQPGASRARLPVFLAKATQTNIQQHHKARSLTQAGHEQLDRGQASHALQTWQSATKIYQQLGDRVGVKGSLVNQSLALQAEGLYPRACKTLLQVIQLEERICESVEPNNSTPKKFGESLDKALQGQADISVLVAGLHSLGDVLRLLGKPDESESALQKALSIAKRQNAKRDFNDLLLSLANTQTTFYRRSLDRYQLTEEPLAKDRLQKQVQENISKALALYRQIANFERASTATQARLNQLSLLLNFRETASEANSAFKPLLGNNKSQIQQVIEPLLTAQFAQFSAIPSIYAQLNFAESLIKIDRERELTQFLFLAEKQPLLTALSLAQKSLQAAEKLPDIRAQSFALGTLGKIYFQLERPERTKPFLETALGKAQSIRAWDIAYRWQQELARLYQATGELDKARKAYAAAINNLDLLRDNLLSINSELQFSFKEKVEPIYRQYIKLLLATPHSDLERAIQINERLQVAELENFLGCGKLDLVSLDKIQFSKNPPAIVHIIQLEKDVEVIVRSTDRSLHRYTQNAALVRSYVDNLLLNLQDPRFVYTDEREILTYTQKLYNLLLAPIKSYLPQSGTLVFVLDSPFQNLPMSLLHDGQNYLVKQYGISVALGSQLRQPQALQKERLKALIAGLSEKSPSFAAPNAPPNLTPLPEVAEEVADVKANTTAAVELLNEQFTSDRFRKQIDITDFPVIHLTTHGQFSSDPQQTVILAWDRAIDVRELNGLLRNRAQSESTSLELLVLSACQTAKGDKRSALGIAGVAAQAGARSTIATLWLVDAASTAQLMGEFYSGLKNGLTKAEALRQAQLTLLSNPKSQHPYYWSSFILVGGWL